jgi:hypothetical protein
MSAARLEMPAGMTREQVQTWRHMRRAASDCLVAILTGQTTTARLSELAFREGREQLTREGVGTGWPTLLEAGIGRRDEMALVETPSGVLA